MTPTRNTVDDYTFASAIADLAALMNHLEYTKKLRIVNTP